MTSRESAMYSNTALVKEAVAHGNIEQFSIERIQRSVELDIAPHLIADATHY